MLVKIALLIMRIGTGMLLVLRGRVRLLKDGMGPNFANSLAVAGAALALIAFRGQDTLALDRVIGKKC